MKISKAMQRRQNEQLEYIRIRESAEREKKDAYLRRLYNLTLADYLQMYSNQEGECKICGVEYGIEKMHVDHCHTSGKVRGLLCMSCNTGLGHFKDSTQRLENAVKYLRETS